MTALRDVSLVMLDEFKDVLPALTIQRAGHSVTEDARTLATVTN